MALITATAEDVATITGQPVAPPKPDYRQEILDKLAGRELPRPNGYNVLIALFITPDFKDLGGGKRIYTAPQTQREDKYQGQVGLVLAIGPQAYKSDNSRSYAEPWCSVGDWVVFPALEHINAKIEYGDKEENRVVMAAVPDDRIIMTVPDPTLVR